MRERNKPRTKRSVTRTVKSFLESFHSEMRDPPAFSFLQGNWRSRLFRQVFKLTHYLLPLTTRPGGPQDIRLVALGADQAFADRPTRGMIWQQC